MQGGLSVSMRRGLFCLSSCVTITMTWNVSKLILIGFLLCSAVIRAQEAAPDVYTLQEVIDQALLGNAEYRNLINSVEVSRLDYEKARAVFKTKLQGNVNTDARSGAEIGSTYNLGLNKRNTSGSAYGVGVYHASFGDQELSEIRFSYTLPFFQNPLTTGKFESDRAELDFRHQQRMAKIGAEELILRVLTTYYSLVAGGKPDCAGAGRGRAGQ